MPRHGTVGWLREVCREFKRDLLSAEHATEDQIAAIWPGGKDNPEHRLRGWIRCYGKLHAMNAVAVRARVERRDFTSSDRRQAILDALADRPEAVELMDGSKVTVCPKSYVALEAVHARNLVLAALIDTVALLSQHGTLDDLPVIGRARLEQTYQQRVIAWIATHSGPGLPYPETEDAPELPAHIVDLHPADLFAIAAAFQRVNVKRLLALESTRGSETRPDWSVFIATLADGMHRSAGEIMRDVSLSGAIAAASERARGHEQAMVAAERKAKEKQQRKVA